jgi:hypothetical protein
VKFAFNFFWQKILKGVKSKSMKTNRIKFCVATTFAVVVFLGVTTMANGQSTDKIPSIEMHDIFLTDAVKIFARQAGINFIIDPKLFSNGEPKVTIIWTNLTAKEALTGLLKEKGLVLIEDKFTTIARITSTNQIPNVVDTSLLGSETNHAASPTNGSILNVRFDDTPLDVALQNLIEHDHLNVILDPKVSDYVDPNDPTDHKFHNAPTVSIRWENITPRQAIVALCENYDLVIVKDSATGVIRIKPKD